MDINRKIESFLTKHRYEKQKTSFTILLSVLIAFCVISSLIMPAISMTIEETQNQTAAVEEVMLLGEETPQPPAGAVNIADFSTKFSIGITQADGSSYPIYNTYLNPHIHDNFEVTDPNQKSVGIEFSMDYQGVISGDLDSNAESHLYFDLSPFLNVDSDMFLESASKIGNVLDDMYDNNIAAGRYEIKGNFVEIQLTPEYVAYVNSGTKSLKGHLEFKGELHRNNNESGDQSFTIGGETIKVSFPDKYATLQKGDPWIDSSTGTVNWTVTINKEYGASLEGYTLTDTVFGQSYFISDSITYNPAGAGTYSNGVITFNNNDSVKNTSTITINYKTKITDGTNNTTNMLPTEYNNNGEGVTSTSLANTATLAKGDYSSPDSKTVSFNKKPIAVSKTGTPDYQTSGGTYNNQIQWQIKITSEYGTSLNGCVIEDSNIPGEVGTVLSVSPSGTITKNADGTWKLSGVADSDKEITITYRASASAGNNNSNTVSVTPPNGGTPVEKTGTVSYKQKSELITPTKNGSYDADTHTITWTVEVRANDGYTLKGYELKDDKFTGTWASSYCSYKGAWKSLNDVTTYDSVNHVLKVKDDVDVDYIQLKYTEVVEPSDPNFTETGVSTAVVSNSLDIPDVPTVTATVNAEYRNTLTKTCLNGSEESSESADAINKTLNWEANITYDGNFLNKDYVDILTSTSGATHTVNMDSIVVRAAAGNVQGWETPLVAGTDYTVTKTENGFQIKFLNTLDNNNYNHVKIRYTTTAKADVTFNENEAGQTKNYTFGNKGEFNGNNTGVINYTIHRTNPVGDKFTNWEIYKEWDAPYDKRQEITVTVYGRVKGTNDNYEEVRKNNGKFLFPGDEGYEDVTATPFTVTLGTGQGNRNWERVWQEINVLQKRTEKDENGNLVTTEYEYKIVETKYGSTTIPENQSYFEYNNGMYKIEQYYNNHVKNTYYPNIDLTLQKSWSGSTLGITQVKVALYYQSGNNAPTPVKKAGDTYVFNGKNKYGNAVTGATDVVETLTLNGSNWSTPQLTGLPSSIIDENGQVQTCYYTLKEIRYYDTDWHTIDPTVFGVDTANGYFEIINPSAINTSGTLTVTNKGTADISITPQKTWTGDNGGADNIASVTFKLMCSSDGGANWQEYVDKDGQSKTITITPDSDTSDNIWKTTEQWTNLPVCELDEQGNEVTWKYQIVETEYTAKDATAATPISGSQFVLVNKGYYNKTDSQNNIQSDGTYAVSNEFHSNDGLTIQVQKNWQNNGSSSESSNRPDSIQVKIERMASNGTRWEAYPDENTTYSLSPSSTGEWKLSLENVPKQSTEGGSIVTYIYRVTEVGYTINNVSHSIPGNQFATTSAGYYEISYGNPIDTSKLESNPTLTIKNSYQPAETTKIIPQKVWVGDEAHPDNRPVAIRLQLQRQSQNADGTWNDWTVVDGYDAIEISGASDVSTWNGTLIDNLPKKAITVNADETVTITNYQYRLIETAYSNGNDSNGNAIWTSLKIGESNNFKLDFTANTGTTLGKYTITYGTTQDGEGKMAVTNTFKQDTGMEKDLVSEKGEMSPVIEIDDLQDVNYGIKMQIDGEWYYVFNWVIHYKSKSDLGIFDNDDLNNYLTPISDTLPEGHTLIYDDQYNGGGHVHAVDGSDSWNNKESDMAYIMLSNKYYGGYYKHPTYMWPGYGADYVQPQTKPEDCYNAKGQIQGSSDKYYYDETTNTVYFNEPDMWADFYIGYATKIKCEELDAKVGDENYTFSNLVKKYTEDGADSVPNGESTQLDVTIKQPSDLVQKSYKETLLPGVVEFSLHLNPEGKNLSNGDTIDIEDLFKATKYFDKCKNLWYEDTQTPGKLVDVLMSNIKLYEVDVNGNKTLLPSSAYTMKFEGGDSVNGGAALLKLTIPDEKHIYIEYTYKLVANKNTPSVQNGCWSSQLVNGMRVKMKPGMVPPAGDIIAFSNKAELKADSASGEDEAGSDHYEISESGGTISTNQLPKIYKVNTGDYTINDLKATFYLAKYENGKWYYVTSVTQTNNKNQLTWGTTGYDGTIVDPNAYSITVEDAYEVQLSQNMLYKLVEVSVPDGYAGSNLFQNDSAAFREMLLQYLNQGSTNYNGVDYADFLSKYRHTNYFIYNSTTASYPEGFDARQVMQIKSGDNIEIPNNELIDIAVQKQWIGTATEAEQNDSSVTLELYWSYTKATTGIPTDAKLVVPAELGIQVLEGTTFSATKTVPMTMLDGTQKIWTDLPNGLDDGTGNKPIYYYIKETAYTIGGKTYQLQADGTFKTEAAEGQTAEIGSYVPIYVGNATNGDATITIKNTQKLMLQKEWKDANNLPLVDSKIPDKILVSIYGVNDQGAETKIFSNVELKKTENWTKDITSLLGTTTLNYKSYVAREEIPEGETALLNRYVISCVFNLNANSGEITVTNKSNVPTTTSVEIQKQWSDGEEMHAADTIHVSLYRSTQKIPAADLKNLTTDILTQYGAVKMENPTGPAPEGETLPDYELDIGTADNWKYLWTNLPLEDDSTPANQYYYYVYEDLTQSNLPATSKNPDGSSKYTPSYTIKSQTTGKTTYTISNYRNSIVAQKVWYDENGKQITNVYDEEGNLVTDNLSSLPTITLDVYKKAVQIPENGLNIVAFGDSITDGYQECSKNGKDYPSKLITLLTNNGYSLVDTNIYNVNKGVSQQQIGGSASEGFRSRVNTDIPTDANIVCFLGGTNDIHQGGSSVRGDPEGVFERFEACISEIQTRTNNNAVIFVGSIPHFDFYKNGTLTDGGSWWNWLSGYSDNDGKIPNDLIDQYNAKIKAYAETHDNVYFVDVCSVVTDDKIRADGCHPNEDGYTAIAQAYYTAINDYYTPSEKLSPSITLNSSNNWMVSYDIEGGSASDEYYVVETNVPAGWEVSYTNNEQTPGSGTPIVVKNTRNIPKTSLSVEKTWVNDSATTDAENREKISLILQRTLTPNDPDSWTDVIVDMPTPTKPENIWTYEYTDLPAQDINGNQYYYKVREEALEGYTTGYGTPTDSETNGLIAVNDGNAGTLHVTNTRGIPLLIKKEWKDENGKALTEGLPNEITVKIRRSTDSTKAPSDQNSLILQVSNKEPTVGVGKDVTVKANKTVTEVTSADESIATVTYDGNEITIRGVAAGTTTITVTDGKTTEKIAVTVSALSITLTGNDVVSAEDGYTIVAGTSGTLQLLKGTTPLTDTNFVSDNTSAVTVDGATLTAVNTGEANITISTSDGEAAVKVTVILPSGGFTIAGGTVVKGKTITLMPNPPYGKFTWECEGSAATVDSKGVVTGISVGTVTIKATRDDGEEATCNITVKGEPDLPNNTAVFENNHTVSIPSGYSATKIIIEFERTSGNNNFYFELNGNQGGGNVNNSSGEWTFVDGHPWGSGINSFTFVSNGEKAMGTLTFGDNISQLKLYNNGSSWNIRYVLTCINASGEEKYVVYPAVSAASLDLPMQLGAASAASSMEFMPMLSAAGDTGSTLDFKPSSENPAIEEVTITLSPTSNPEGEAWTYLAKNLDVYDANSQPYYYWVEEVKTGELSNYEVSYLFTDGDDSTTYAINAANPGAATATIRNTKTQNESYELPSTGGIGTRWYTISGLLVLGGGCGGFATTHLIRRFRKRKCTK